MLVHIGRIRDPFEEDQKDQVAKDEHQENELGNELHQDFSILSLQNLVPGAQSHSKHHVDKAKNQ